MISPLRLERRSSRICAFTALLGVVCAGSVAGGAESVRVPARLEWGTSVCGDAQGFSSRVQRRTQRVRFVDSGEDLQVFLSIEPQGTGLEARVVMKTSAGKHLVTRSIASPDCDDALDALALVVAISLEGRAQELERVKATARPAVPSRRRPAPPAPAPVRAEPPAPAPSVEPVPPADEPPVPEPAPAARVEETPAPPSPPAESGAEPRSAVVVEPPPTLAVSERSIDALPSEPSEPRRLGLWFAVGASAVMTLGVAPKAMLGGGVWLGATWERESILSPSVTLALSHVRLDGFEHVDGQADFQLNTGSLALCPLKFGNGSFELRPCVSGTTGDFSSQGEARFFSEDALRRWASFGGVLQAVARFGPLELRGSFSAEAALVRDRFRFGPPCSVSPENTCEFGIFHDVGQVATRLDAGAGMTF